MVRRRQTPREIPPGSSGQEPCSPPSSSDDGGDDETDAGRLEAVAAAVPPRDAVCEWLASFAAMFRPNMRAEECEAVAAQLFAPCGSMRFECEAGRTQVVPYDLVPLFLHARWRPAGRLLAERLELRGGLECVRAAQDTIVCRAEAVLAASYACGGVVLRHGTFWASFAPSGHAVTVHFRLRAAEVRPAGPGARAPDASAPHYLGAAAERFCRVADALWRTAYRAGAAEGGVATRR